MGQPTKKELINRALRHYLGKKEQIDLILAEQHSQHPHEYFYQANFIPYRGWYAYSCDRKDMGQFLGESFEDAIANAANIYELEK
jgi:hypothetical protein